MEINYDHIYYFLAVTVAFQSIFFSIFLLTFNSHKNKGNYFLAGYLFFTGFHFINLAFHEFMSQLYPFEVSLFCSNAYGPLLYFYLTYQLNIKGPLVRLKFLWVHFIPIMYTLIWLLFIKAHVNIDLPLSSWIHIPTYMFLTAYLVVCNYHLYQKKGRLGLLVSSTLMNWLRFLYGSSLVITVSFAYTTVFIGFFSMASYFVMMLVVTAGKLIFISGLLFLALRYPDLIVKRNYLVGRIAEDQDEKYAYSNLDKSKAKQILNKLQKAMEVNKIHKTPGISLEDLSELLGEEAKYVSQSINQLTGKNFKEYINQVRVKEAAGMFSNPEYSGMRINEVMFDVGFRSKSSFNSNFKKYTKFTPKEYREKYGNGR